MTTAFLRGMLPPGVVASRRGGWNSLHGSGSAHPVLELRDAGGGYRFARPVRRRGSPAGMKVGIRLSQGLGKLKTLIRRHTTFRTVQVVIERHVRPVSILVEAAIRAVDEAHVADARSMEGAERIEEFRGFLARGDLGYYAYRDECVVHRAWVRLGPATIPLWHSYAPLELTEGEAYIHYCETHPSARGLGIYPAVLSHIAADLRSRGLHEILISTTSDNEASLRGIVRAGFEECRRVELRVRFGVGTFHDLAPRHESSTDHD